MSLTFTLSEYKKDGEVLFSYNLTHNLAEMARQAGLGCLWHPEAAFAWEIAGDIERGLIQLVCAKEQYEQYNPENGWGSWSDLVLFAATALQACRNHPKAYIEVER